MKGVSNGRGGGTSEVFLLCKGGTEKVKDLPFSHCVPLPPIINGQSLIIGNFECLVVLSPSEMKQEVCKLLILISQGIDRYKVLVVEKMAS